ncbi:MAG: glycosyltransferase family 39 protein [Geminicoccaceae bacterium]|nr:glycosyltransferase family 39 protein [Geminicoccaceae bacterium]MCX7629628.1 glycosyltransferase family 39 protein [Geminicoccaceae bacterium]MDW8341672.1 glycosyltransferase family 39 protein [Geminicoccaceae bacterium]
MERVGTAAETRESAGGSFRPALFLFGASLAFYAINLDRPEIHDELHHVLAARGLLETGEPRIAEGLYWRGYLVTRLVAFSFALFGEGLWSARLPSVLVAALLPPLLFFWVRRAAGPLAAWLAAGLYAVSPFAVEIAQFARFYALQTLAFTLAAWAVWSSFCEAATLGGRLARAAIAFGGLALAFELQPVTAIGVLGLAAWAVPALLLRLPDRRSRVLFAIGLVLAGLVFLLFFGEERLRWLWRLYREVPLFNVPYKDQFWFYYVWYLMLYPTLWTLLAPCTLLALSRAPALASFAAATFAVSFLLSSFAGSKGLRYLAYAQPLLFVLWGIGLARVVEHLPALWQKGRKALAEVLVGLGPRADAAARVLLAAAAVHVLLVNPFWLRTIGLLAAIPIGPEIPDPDWRRAAAVLRPLLAEVAVVTGTDDLANLYYFGRHDVLYSPTKFHELYDVVFRDFDRDPRTGRPVIATPAALERVIRCYPSGLFATAEGHWGKRFFVDEPIIALLERTAERVPLPPGSHVRAYRWSESSRPSLPAEACRDLPRPHPAGNPEK